MLKNYDPTTQNQTNPEINPALKEYFPSSDDDEDSLDYDEEEQY